MSGHGEPAAGAGRAEVPGGAEPAPPSPALLDLDDAALAELVGAPAYRARQVKRWLWEAGAESADEMSDLPNAVRARLAEVGVSPLTAVSERDGDAAMTWKWLHHGRDGAAIESVLMRYAKRATVCVSSQAGCAMACPFCATGQDGFQRQLSVGEITAQVLHAQRRLRVIAADGRSPERVSNVVFMGMGEPLANYPNLVAAVRRLHDDVGIGARSLTVSTIGIPDRIRALAEDLPPVTLAWSLHAPDDELRDELVPANRRWPVEAVLEAVADYHAAGGRRVTIEYTLMDGVNDQRWRAIELARIARRIRAHVNCIPMNATGDARYRPSRPEVIAAFVDELEAQGANATLRRNRGTSIDGACGQLRRRVAVRNRH